MISTGFRKTKAAELRDMRVLVTGAGGFIGSHLAEALAVRGMEVRLLDNFQSGTYQNLTWIKPGQSVQILEGDLRNDEQVSKAIEGCQWVFHLAAMPSVPRSIQFPIESHAVNLDGSLKLLQAASRAGVERFIFASSSAIYGESDVPVKQEGLPPAPLSPYALQKYSAERYGQLYSQFYGLATVSLRYFNVFGPRQSFTSPYSGVIARFCHAAITGEVPTIYGDGLQSRDFTYIDNVISANLQAATAPRELVSGKVFNVAGGESVTLLAILDRLSQLSGRPMVPRFEPERPGDIHYSHADIGLARSILNYVPTVRWDKGLEKTLEWYRTSGATFLPVS